jgi:hypothetical protein
MTQIAAGVQTIQVQPSRDPRWQKQGGWEGMIIGASMTCPTTEHGAISGSSRNSAGGSKLLGHRVFWAEATAWPPLTSGNAGRCKAYKQAEGII